MCFLVTEYILFTVVIYLFHCKNCWFYRAEKFQWANMDGTRWGVGLPIIVGIEEKVIGRKVLPGELGETCCWRLDRRKGWWTPREQIRERWLPLWKPCWDSWAAALPTSQKLPYVPGSPLSLLRSVTQASCYVGVPITIRTPNEIFGDLYTEPKLHLGFSNDPFSS